MRRKASKILQAMGDGTVTIYLAKKQNSGRDQNLNTQP